MFLLLSCSWFFDHKFACNTTVLLFEKAILLWHRHKSNDTQYISQNVVCIHWLKYVSHQTYLFGNVCPEMDPGKRLKIEIHFKFKTTAICNVKKTIKLSHKRTDHNHTELKLHFGSKRGKRHREVCPIRISLVHDPACNRFAIKSTEIVRSKQSNQTLFTQSIVPSWCISNVGSPRLRVFSCAQKDGWMLLFQNVWSGFVQVQWDGTPNFFWTAFQQCAEWGRYYIIWPCFLYWICCTIK